MKQESSMYRLLKSVHLLGLTLFLGSIFSHIVAGAAGGVIGGVGFLAARAEIDAATRALTLPGLIIAILSGIGLALLSPARRAWMGVHAALAAAIALLAAAVIVPAGRAAFSGTAALAQGQGNVDHVRAALMTEHVAGAVNILLTLAVLALGVYKPALRLFARRNPRPHVGA
jgi:hypothetical protein